MNYEEALEYIAGLAPRGWRLGLDRMQEFASRADFAGSLGDGATPKFIHVAGTNGKGSTTAFLQSMLVEHGKRTGAFFSPFVFDPRERVQFGREYISEEAIAQITTKLAPVGESLANTMFGGITEFEFKTAIGFEFWKQKACEWVALEVGLGGRLDATNIITPASCAIVSIGWDHMSILGVTLNEIAMEKAGILKREIPGVVGRMEAAPRQTIERIAAAEGVPIWRMDYEVTYESRGVEVVVRTPRSEIVLEPSLFGGIQHHNVAVAYAALELSGIEIDPESVKRGAQRASIPGRFTRLVVDGRTWILDGAHNLDSAQVLAGLLGEAGISKVACLTGMLQGHDPEDFYKPLAGLVDQFYVTPIDFHRTRDAAELSGELTELGLRSSAFPSLNAAIEALVSATPNDEVVLVTGSFYLVGEVMRLLLRAPLG